MMLGLEGLGANVSQTGDIGNPFWCAVIPASWAPGACKPPSEEEQAIAASNLAECSRIAQTQYPISTSLLGSEGACHLAAGDYNGRLFLGAAALAFLLFAQMR